MGFSFGDERDPRSDLQSGHLLFGRSRVPVEQSRSISDPFPLHTRLVRTFVATAFSYSAMNRSWMVAATIISNSSAPKRRVVPGLTLLLSK